MAFHILGYLLIAGVTQVSARNESSGTDCMQPATALPCNVLFEVIRKDGLFSITEETLEDDCPKILESFECLEDHWNKCNPSSARNLIASLSGVKGIIEELCNRNSKLRADYGKMEFCLREVSDALQNCTFRAEAKAVSQKRKSFKTFQLSANAYRCLAHIELVSCVGSVAEKHCGSDAGQLLRRLVEQSVRPYRQLNCRSLANLKGPSRREEYKRLLF